MLPRLQPPPETARRQVLEHLSTIRGVKAFANLYERNGRFFWASDTVQEDKNGTQRQQRRGIDQLWPALLGPSSWAFGPSVPDAPHSRLGRSRQSAREGAYPSQSQQHTTANSLGVLSLLK